VEETEGTEPDGSTVLSHTRICTYTEIHTHIHTCMHTNACTHAHMHRHAHIYIHIHMHRDTHIHTPIHTPALCFLTITLSLLLGPGFQRSSGVAV
jgi:hypothetical protein